jgi:hypothetical protein
MVSPTSENPYVTKFQGIVEKIKTQRTLNFNKPFMDKLERATFSRPKRYCFSSDKGEDRIYINNKMSKEKPMLVIMFDGVIGFT